MRCCWKRVLLAGIALLTGILPFLAPEACARALREGLMLCGGPLLLSLFPFFIVSTLLVRSGGGDLLGQFLYPLAWLAGAKSPNAGSILLMGLTGGFAPAANAAAQAVRSGKLSAKEAAGLLPACICSGPSFVILTVGQGMLGSTVLGIQLFAAQAIAGVLSAAILCRFHRRSPVTAEGQTASLASLPPLRLDIIIADAAITYCKLCGFILYFRMITGGLSALWPQISVPAAMILEVCSGCDLASRTGRWASWLCCAAISLQGTSVLMQVRTICPAEISFRPLLTGRLLHLPLSLVIFRLLLWLPGGTITAGVVSQGMPSMLRRVPPDCAVLVFLGCCLLICQLCRDVPETHG